MAAIASLLGYTLFIRLHVHLFCAESICFRHPNPVPLLELVQEQNGFVSIICAGGLDHVLQQSRKASPTDRSSIAVLRQQTVRLYHRHLLAFTTVGESTSRALPSCHALSLAILSTARRLAPARSICSSPPQLGLDQGSLASLWWRFESVAACCRLKVTLLCT